MAQTPDRLWVLDIGYSTRTEQYRPSVSYHRSLDLVLITLKATRALSDSTMSCTDLTNSTAAIVLILFGAFSVTLLHLISVLVSEAALEPDLEMAPERNALQHDTPPPYDEIDPLSLNIMLGGDNAEDMSKGEVGAHWREE